MGKSTIYMAIFNSYVSLPESNHYPATPRWKTLLFLFDERGQFNYIKL